MAGEALTTARSPTVKTGPTWSWQAGCCDSHLNAAQDVKIPQQRWCQCQRVEGSMRKTLAGFPWRLVLTFKSLSRSGEKHGEEEGVSLGKT